MFINKKLTQNVQEQGQALMFVIVALTIALSIGINASVRTISSLSRTTRTDTATRALAAAEGGIERFLALSIAELEVAVGGGCPIGTRDDPTDSCRILFDSTSDVITSEAYVNAERYVPSSYPFELANGQVKEVNLYDFSANTFYSNSQVRICWDSVTASDLYYIAYNSSGIMAQGGITGDNPPALPYEKNGFVAAGAGQDGFDDCATVTIGNNIYGLRIRSLGGDSSVGIYPVGGATLPLQGYRITSVGRVTQDLGVTASRTIRIVRTLPYLPGGFDFGFYSDGPIVN